ncbi:hypothetical protein [Niveispirillum sp. KHB5.9]|uniref:hypothetical protein n=1 Tax=Niveispirillum sp. KHB5.9 TaxID=3400269 RepID=UPI003A867C06
MHVATLLKPEMFEIAIDGAPTAIAGLFPDWHLHDRFGLVIDEAFGGIGATHLLQVAQTQYYAARPSRRENVYPEIYAFHIGKGHGAHAPYDFWPRRREVILETLDPRDVLDAINDRGITRLAVPNRPPVTVEHRPKEVEAALDRITSCFVYGAMGRVAGGDVAITGRDRRTEFNPNQVLRPSPAASAARTTPPSGRPVKETEDGYTAWLIERGRDVTDADRARAQARREALKADGLATETYHRTGVMDALGRLAAAGRWDHLAA